MGEISRFRFAPLEMTAFLRLLVMPSEVEASRAQVNGIECFHANGPKEHLFSGGSSVTSEETGIVQLALDP